MKRPSPPMFHSVPWVLGWASMAIISPIVMFRLICRTIKVITSHFLGQSDLEGKVILITGASSGLGKALAHCLYEKGCRLILASRNVDALEMLKESVLTLYKPPELHVPIVMKLDLEDLNSIPLFVEKLLKNYGHVDVLINNAGVSYRGDILSTDVSLDIKVMVVNYFGQVALTKCILKSMVTQKSGHIVAVSSLQGKLSLPFRSCYGSSKHALNSFFDCLRAEVAEDNIDVTVVSPGYIDTNLSKNALRPGVNVDAFETKAMGDSAEKVAERIVECLITKEKDVLICSPFYRLVVYLSRLFPSLSHFVQKYRAASMRRCQIKRK